jgi:hypothetical protein
MLKLQLMGYMGDLVTKTENGITSIKDPIRKKFVVSTPEELVRQLLIQYFVRNTSFSKNYIKVEKSITLNGMKRRYDLVIYDRNLHPYLLVECKAPEVRLSQESFDQIFRYNLIMRAPYLLVTNGIRSICAAMGTGKEDYVLLDHIPEYR